MVGMSVVVFPVTLHPPMSGVFVSIIHSSRFQRSIFAKFCKMAQVPVAFDRWLTRKFNSR